MDIMNSKMQFPLVALAMAGTTTGVWGCTIASESDATKAPSMSDEAALDAPDAGSALPEGAEAQKAASYTLFFEDASGLDTLAVASSGKLCVVSEIRGDTHGSGRTHRGFDLSGGASSWSLRFWNFLAYVGGTCVNRSAFRVPVDGVIEGAAGGYASAQAWSPSSDEFSSGDTVGYISGLRSNPGEFWGLPLTFDGGGFEGMGEMVRVDQANSVANPHVLVADVDHVGLVAGAAHSFRAGVPGDVKPKFWGYKDGSMVRARWGASGTNFTMNISTFNGYSGFWMAQTSDALCVMTRYQGRLGGNEAHVRAYLHGTQWKSTIKSDYPAEASYRCMAYDQR
jgi:hypothetical protein